MVGGHLLPGAEGWSVETRNRRKPSGSCVLRTPRRNIPHKAERQRSPRRPRPRTVMERTTKQSLHKNHNHISLLPPPLVHATGVTKMVIAPHVNVWGVVPRRQSSYTLTRDAGLAYYDM